MFIIDTVKLNIELHKRNRKINTLKLQKESLEELIKSDLYSNFMKMISNDDKVNTFSEENTKLRKEKKDFKLKIIELQNENKELRKRGGKHGKKSTNDKFIHKSTK